VVFKSWVRKSTIYQQVPNPGISGLSRRWLAGFLFFLSQELKHGRKVHRALKPTRNLKDMHAGRDVLIIGNGPSSLDISNRQLTRFREAGGVIFVMNDFYRSPLANLLTPDFYFITDPFYQSLAPEFKGYLWKNTNVNIVTNFHERKKAEYLQLPNDVHWINPISAMGLWHSISPLKAHTGPPSVLFRAIEFAVFIGCKTIYVCGAENSMYKFHKHDQMGSVFTEVGPGLHSYTEPAARQYSIPQMTRNMSDVLFASAIFLRDLRRLGSKYTVVNVSPSDFTNDAFPFACLIK
jgi:hypothetical protein